MDWHLKGAKLGNAYAQMTMEKTVILFDEEFLIVTKQKREGEVQDENVVGWRRNDREL
jgi:hypothetical protein